MRHVIKIPFINKGIEFIDLPSIFRNNNVISAILHISKTQNLLLFVINITKKGKRKVQEVPQSQTAVLPRPQKEEETDKSKQAQTEQTYEKH